MQRKPQSQIRMTWEEWEERKTRRMNRIVVIVFGWGFPFVFLLWAILDKRVDYTWRLIIMSVCLFFIILLFSLPEKK